MKEDSPTSQKERGRLGKRWVHCLTESAAVITKKIFNLEQHKKKSLTPKLLTGNSSSGRLKTPLQKKNCDESAVVGYSMLSIVKPFPKRKTQCGFDKIKVHFSRAYTLFFVVLFGNCSVLQGKQKLLMINVLCCGKHTLCNNTTLVSYRPSSSITSAQIVFQMSNQHFWDKSFL